MMILMILVMITMATQVKCVSGLMEQNNESCEKLLGTPIRKLVGKMSNTIAVSNTLYHIRS